MSLFDALGKVLTVEQLTQLHDEYGWATDINDGKLTGFTREVQDVTEGEQQV